jgi:hypothetical protein
MFAMCQVENVRRSVVIAACMHRGVPSGKRPPFRSDPSLHASHGVQVENVRRSVATALESSARIDWRDRDGE